ncbi:MAG: 30S ribosomal protein S3 [bacterium]
MGQKVNPKIFRIGINRTWISKWFSHRDYGRLLKEDQKIRKFISQKLKEASVDRIEIERPAGNLIINIFSAKPGLIIGRAGAGIEDLKKSLQNRILSQSASANRGGQRTPVNLNIQEVSRPDLSANIVMQSIISDLEKRIPFRRAMKQALARVERAGALGAKVMVGGRLNGADIARQEKLAWGKIPLHTLRADIDYARGFARTIFGTIGVKVWIYRGEIFEKENKINKED